MLANSSILLVFFAHVDVARISNALCELTFQDRTRAPVFDVVSVSCATPTQSVVHTALHVEA